MSILLKTNDVFKDKLKIGCFYKLLKVFIEAYTGTILLNKLYAKDVFLAFKDVRQQAN